MTPSISRTAIRKNAIVVNIAVTPLAGGHSYALSKIDLFTNG